MDTVTECPACGEKDYVVGTPCAVCKFAGEVSPIFATEVKGDLTYRGRRGRIRLGTFTRDPDGRAHLTLG